MISKTDKAEEGPGRTPPRLREEQPTGEMLDDAAYFAVKAPITASQHKFVWKSQALRLTCTLAHMDTEDRRY